MKWLKAHIKVILGMSFIGSISPWDLSASLVDDGLCRDGKAPFLLEGECFKAKIK